MPNVKNSDPIWSVGAVQRKFLCLLVSATLVAINALAVADHEPDHRYTVMGYVLNEDESPVSLTTVIISANGIGARGKTDKDGYFSIRLHLHDSDLGRKIHIKTDRGEGTISASFDPSDRLSAREHRVDIIGGRLIEGQASNYGKIPDWVYYLSGLAILIIAAIFLSGPLKRLKKRLRAPEKTDPVHKRKLSKPKPKPKKRHKGR